MKLKKTLSGVLAAAMVVSLTPAMAFASTTNTVSAVPTVSTDTELPAVTVALKVADTVDWSTGEEQIIKLSFGNAEWNNTPSSGTVAGTGLYSVTEVVANATYNVSSITSWNSGHNISEAASGFTVTGAGTTFSTDVDTKHVGSATAAVSGTTLTLTGDPGANVAFGDLVYDEITTKKAISATSTVSYVAPEGLVVGGTFKNLGTEKITTVYSVSDNSIELGIKNTDQITKDDVITLTFLAGTLKSLNEDGPVTINIDGLDSKITSQTLTVASVGTGKTVATTNGDVKSYARKSAIKVNTTIEIRESSVNALEGTYQVIKMSLPKGVEWNEVDLSGSFMGSARPSALAAYTTVSDNTSFTAAGQKWLNDDKNVLYISVPFSDNSAVRQVLTVQPYITITKDASFGDINVELDGWKAGKGSTVSSASDLKIAVYGEENVTVTTDETVPTIVAGYIKNDKEKATWLRVTIKENIAGALSLDRPIDFTLPKQVQVLPNAVQAVKYYVGSNPDKDKAKTFTSTEIEFDGEAPESYNRSYFTLNISQTAGLNAEVTANQIAKKASTITLYIPVTVEADYAGDISMNISGAKAGIEDTDLVVATVVSPIEVSGTSTDVKNGVQKQELSDIVITETKAGYLGKGGKNTSVTVAIDTLGFGGINLTDATVKVTDGNLDISGVEVSNGQITFKIKEASSKASTITISNVVAALNRTMPEGGYDVQVYGSALIDNTAYNKKNFSYPDADEDDTNPTKAKSKDGDVYAAKLENFINIVTPAESTTVSEKVDAKFVIGEASYTNNGAATEMDAAAYIDSHNRTMVPIRYVANACGISENDIRWEAGSQTAIINGLNTVVTVKMGSNKLQTSTGEITMDTVAVNNNGRIYVPVRYIANALGANVSWDAATKTVTLTK